MSDSLESVKVNAEIEELALSLSALPQVECPLTHIFAPGVYWREIFMPALPGGTFIIGAEHRTEHLNVVLRGRVRVMMEGELREIVAPARFMSKPGVRKILHVLEDTVWATVHPTKETDLLKLEQELIVADESYHRYERAKADMAKLREQAPVIENP